ncbi:MAG: hypothetical protein R3F45_14740 [Gammaproteobacteria bacterium]
MNIWACEKRVTNREGGIEITPDGLVVDEDAVRWMIDLGGQVAAQQTLRFKEALRTGSVTAVRLGPSADAGIRSARVIVANNSYPETPINLKCDCGDVGEMFQVVPALTQALRRSRQDRA